MKRLISLMTFVFIAGAMALASGPVASGNTHCCLGTYVIEKATNPIVVDGRELNSFEVFYENSDCTVTIGVDNSDKKCTKYIVRSDDLTIQYDCNSKYFGVALVDKAYEKSGYSTDRKMLNNEEYFHQKVITRNEKTELEHVKLISVFYPRLVNDYENVFAVK